MVTACVLGARTPPAVEVELPDSRTLAGDFMLRQLVEYRYDGRHGRFEAVIQKRCDDLTLIGLAPVGPPLFSLRQRGRGVEVESQAGAWPFPPEYMLLDLHRSLLLPLREPPPADGFYTSVAAGEVYDERWEQGLLRERRFRTRDGRPPGEVIVRFVGGARRQRPPQAVELRNERYGYELRVTTLERVELSCSGP